MIKKHLLYCHGIALSDLLVYWLDYFYGNSDDERARHNIQTILSFMHQIKSLLENDIVFFIDELVSERWYRYSYAPRNAIWPPHLSSLRYIIDDFAQSDSWTPFLGKGFSKESFLPVIDVVESSISVTLAHNVYHKGNHDLYFPLKYFVDVFRSIVKKIMLQVKVSELELTLMERLLSLELPNLSRLSPADIAQVRSNEDRVLGKHRNRISLG